MTARDGKKGHGMSGEDVTLGGDRYGREDDVYGSCSCGETRPHSHTRSGAQERHEDMVTCPTCKGRACSEGCGECYEFPSVAGPDAHKMCVTCIGAGVVAAGIYEPVPTEQFGRDAGAANGSSYADGES